MTSDFRSGIGPATLLLAVSLLVRMWGIADTEHYLGDQNTVVMAAYSFPETGLFSPDTWEQPPFHYYLIRLGTFLFGDNAYGWRMKNVLLGSLTVPLLYFLGSALFADRRIALLASLLLLFDPLHLYYSQTIFGEISSLPFFLGAVLVTIRYLQGRSASPLWAGVLLGIALAQKWYYLGPLLLLMLVAVGHRMKTAGARPIELVHLFSVYVILPLTIYVLAFAPWFQRGYGMSEFIGMQYDAYYFLQTTRFLPAVLDFFRPSDHPAWAWFLKPVILGWPIDLRGGWGRYFVIMNNAPVWMLTLPSLLHLAYRSCRERSVLLALPALLFSVSYFQFAALDRVVFLYSAIVLLPFAFLGIAQFIVVLLDAFWLNERRFWFVTAGCTAWGLYLVPLVLNWSVPVLVYTPFFALLGASR